MPKQLWPTLQRRSTKNAFETAFRQRVWSAEKVQVHNMPQIVRAEMEHEMSYVKRTPLHFELKLLFILIICHFYS